MERILNEENFSPRVGGAPPSAISHRGFRGFAHKQQCPTVKAGDTDQSVNCFGLVYKVRGVNTQNRVFMEWVQRFVT